MKKQFYSQKRKQLKGLIKRLNFLLKHKNEKTESIIKKLVLRIRRIIGELGHLFSRRELKRVLGAAAILIGLGFANRANAQSFAPPQLNPFGLDSVGNISFPTFSDIDGDGDLDLFVGDNPYSGLSSLQYFENTGSETNPQFAAPVANPFGLVSTNYSFPTFADLDGDGDADLLVGEFLGTMQYFENTGSATNPQFAAPQVNPFGLVSTTLFATPAFADLDGDGDIDLLSGEYIGSMQYFENTGSATNPQFAAPQENPFGLVSTDDSSFPAFSDLDGDGDIDLLVGEYYGNMKYFENTGSATNPQFAAPQTNPFGLVATYQNALPTFADLDNDGDIDLLAGEYYGALKYFENTIVDGIAEIEQLNLALYPNPVRDILNLEVEEQIGRIEIMDVTGKQINTLENPGKQVSLSDLQPGIYMLKITSVDGNYTVKKIHKL